MATQGYGCMGLSAFYSSAKDVTPEKAKVIIHHVVNAGVPLLNSATFYGPLNAEGFGHNLRLLKDAIKGLDRSKFQLMVKICMDTRSGAFNLKAKPEEIRADVDYALEQLGVDYIDIIVMCRVPKDIPIEEVVREMKVIVDEGKARHIGLSEASASTIRRAHAVVPIYCIEQEWSLWSRDIEKDIVPACRELGIKIVAYSPLGRGFLTGTIKGREDIQDYRLMAPKFAEGNIDHNLKLVQAAESIAARKGITVGQLALAWLHAQGPDVIPIPGTTNPAHFDVNWAARNIQLTPAEQAEIDTIFTVDASLGERYPGNHNTFHEQD